MLVVNNYSLYRLFQSINEKMYLQRIQNNLSYIL